MNKHLKNNSKLMSPNQNLTMEDIRARQTSQNVINITNQLAQ